ncbi:hypothetical protein MARPO_0010s0166 [Marchantia polymorpha]|uniref:Uncharacterized protein n=1 Tax=Marchantia polymorpha TaxID=3197 RepID=A0A2R6XL37_MARPO|nr:hypothetical protein MARPO_0010s0166 [Marchantia polymorpha]|eukprot:PTQ46791.1 hypothetical protein MARPO_0010s0166 [Marchantia polymorpha]
MEKMESDDESDASSDYYLQDSNIMHTDYETREKRKKSVAEEVQLIQVKLARNHSTLAQYVDSLYTRSTVHSRNHAAFRGKYGFTIKKVIPPQLYIDLEDPCSLPSSLPIKVIKEIERTIPKPSEQLVPPRYTTWTFAKGNKRMMEGQSIENQRRIYYDKKKKETVLASDSDDELRSRSYKINAVEREREFSDVEDFVIWMATQAYGVTDFLFQHISAMLERKQANVKERYELLVVDDTLLSRLSHIETFIERTGKQDIDSPKLNGEYFEVTSKIDRLSVKHQIQFSPPSGQHKQTVRIRCERETITKEPIDLVAAMSTYDNLFCRLCLKFHCELHGYSQPLILPNELQNPEPRVYDPAQPCGEYCYLLFNIIPGKEAWSILERDLFCKGLQIFGKSSCLIAQNLLKGCKTCSEVASRIATVEAERSYTPQEEFSSQEGAERPKTQKKKAPRKTRFTISSQRTIVRRNGHNGRHQFYPCKCGLICGQQCICKDRKNSCEKFCGCPGSCKNRFPGCNCVKSQCSTKLCPCFNASRECDPDVCRNCSIDCELTTSKDSSTISASGRKQSKCQNMRILLNQKKSVLLARSDVIGWGLFLKSDAKKDDYLGEYTGELISQREADKRGKIYDIVNLSFLFDLNDKFVIDAYRLGSKFKFANHSSTPNCYPKVVLVAGEHRVGIFAKRNIAAGEELLFDYQYEKKLGERTPWWAKGKKRSTVGSGSSISSSGPRQKTYP